MLTQLSLRLRIFLFFCLLGGGGAAIALAAIWLGYARVAETSVADGFVFAATLTCFGILALTAGVWLLFDENVAKPIERLSAEMRARAHAGIDREVDTTSARYLGDLAPAASAVTEALSQTALSTAARIAAETERLSAEKAQLTALLTEIPVATILVNPAGQIVLYDGQAAEVLSGQGVARLNAAISDYFDSASLDAARQRMHKTGKDVSFIAKGHDGQQSYDARMKPMDAGGYMLIIDAAHVNLAPEAARPLVYDFDLLDQRPGGAIEDTPLRALSYTVFDTETTGLLPHKDDIVQIGAVRVVNGRIVPGEQIDQLVDPGRPIPPASTRVHHVTDAMVAGKPDVAEAGRQFHKFAKGSVIVAHNAPFDMAFLHRDKARMGVEWDNPILDTVLLSAVLFGASQTHTLDALCQRLSITIPPDLRHTALGDAVATAQVLVHLLPMLEARGMTTFGEVLAETRRHGRLLEDLN
ncbi:3'-5' exonuclease [Tropicibacter naphthalenivorans]|uniref:DNA-directed DNA polymerase n=1 Tax=Tropicibacter naphthalenivorans TaxID=441103 RepID=A0A0N7M126_9RHOB|nr:3'-5' exonuclease [Tropicibacter naphthalenivorans]CUH82089.1 DNA polymerase III PolC-type [Tropicibacter naphthalenivorans]SMD08497.1 DNA polymerase-3 subunit epsilon [Tropicibacter naphthalenivorans]